MIVSNHHRENIGVYLYMLFCTAMSIYMLTH